MHNENYYLIDDGGHSWLKVPMQDLADLGLANKISSFSYVKGNYAYLEEDCDLAVFFAAFIQEHGYKPKYVSRYIDDPYSKDNPRNFCECRSGFAKDSARSYSGRKIDGRRKWISLAFSMAC